MEKPDTVHPNTGEKGNLLIMKKKSTGYEEVKYISFPKSLSFLDYSDIAYDGKRLAVLSQESSAVYIAELSDTWNLNHNGNIYYFPIYNNYPVYCNLEGITFINETTLGLVSDSSKKKQPSHCKEKSEMFHIWKIRE